MVQCAVYWNDMQVTVHEAKARFSALLRRVAAGEEVIISRAGKPVARLVPMGAARARQFGVDRGVFDVPEDFDAPLPVGIFAASEACDS